MAPNPITRAGRAVGGTALYALTLPERAVRSMTGFFGGLVKETTEIIVPTAVKDMNTYNIFVGNILRFAVENVGGVEGAYDDDEGMGDDFAVRKTLGNVIEAVGIATIHFSPLWVFAALSDGVAVGKSYMARLHEELVEKGLIDEDTDPGSIHSMLEGIERATTSFARNIDMPPLSRDDILANLKEIGDSLKDLGGRSTDAAGEALGDVGELMQDFLDTATDEGKGLLELGGVMALRATNQVKRTAATATIAPVVASKMFYDNILVYYRDTLVDIHQQGYGEVASAALRPYGKALLQNFQSDRITLTEKVFKGSASGLRWLLLGSRTEEKDK